jgi:hypothetical protein
MTMLLDAQCNRTSLQATQWPGRRFPGVAVLEIAVTDRLAGPSVRDAATGRNVEFGPELTNSGAWADIGGAAPAGAMPSRNDQHRDAGTIQLVGKPDRVALGFPSVLPWTELAHDRRSRRRDRPPDRGRVRGRLANPHRPVALVAARLGDRAVAISKRRSLYMPNGTPAPSPLNSRYFRPVRGKETRARRWDLQFEFTSLHQRVRCEPRSRAPPRF